ncbi:hypothetical protein STK_13470 [Sulfurisphaera tokodaii str. 7]|uniref:Uncharacterized protein n=1 Tax=Sulfurisphaera tokodaii (strain DSM 16993 / JCM 10545 / NBRC 100140 / 7) TaxID=273063 RepID=Q971L0_SULTO|nr:hypothetical protein [Sulfurisphaera tokodaii]BAB66410.1 hypothetical protein STK_13470 [Sulfurisphaera tokodaii str. 7]
MRGIYILGIVIILLIVIGVLFYYENIKFDINVIPYSLTYESTYPGHFILKLEVNAINYGILPMTLTASIVLGVSLHINSSITGTLKQYINSTTISVGPTSKSKSLLTFILPNNIEFISYVYIEASGYYNYHYNNQSATNLITQIDQMIENVYKIDGLPITTITASTNISLIKSAQPLYYPVPYNITYFYNSTYYENVYLIMNPSNFNIKTGTYKIEVYTNNTKIFSTSIQIPYEYNELLIPILTTPLLKYPNSSYIINVNILFEGPSIYYISAKIMI